MKKGDAIATVAQPVARTIDYWIGTNLQNCGGCHTMIANLNAGMSFGDAIYDRFFKKPKEQDGFHNHKSNQ
jgi:hypothetical protein